MNKRQINHLLTLAKRAILNIFDLDDYDFSVMSYHIMKDDYIWIGVLAKKFIYNDYEECFFKLRIEKDKVTYLKQVEENDI